MNTQNCSHCERELSPSTTPYYYRLVMIGRADGLGLDEAFCNRDCLQGYLEGVEPQKVIEGNAS